MITVYIIEELNGDLCAPVWIKANMEMPCFYKFYGNTIPIFDTKEKALFWASEWARMTDKKYKIKEINI